MALIEEMAVKHFIQVNVKCQDQDKGYVQVDSWCLDKFVGGHPKKAAADLSFLQPILIDLKIQCFEARDYCFHPEVNVCKCRYVCFLTVHLLIPSLFSLGLETSFHKFIWKFIMDPI